MAAPDVPLFLILAMAVVCGVGGAGRDECKWGWMSSLGRFGRSSSPHWRQRVCMLQPAPATFRRCVLNFWSRPLTGGFATDLLPPRTQWYPPDHLSKYPPVPSCQNPPNHFSLPLALSYTPRSSAPTLPPVLSEDAQSSPPRPMFARPDIKVEPSAAPGPSRARPEHHPGPPPLASLAQGGEGTPERGWNGTRRGVCPGRAPIGLGPIWERRERNSARRSVSVEALVPARARARARARTWAWPPSAQCARGAMPMLRGVHARCARGARRVKGDAMRAMLQHAHAAARSHRMPRRVWALRCSGAAGLGCWSGGVLRDGDTATRALTTLGQHARKGRPGMVCLK